MPFCRHREDESICSKGNYVALLDILAQHELLITEHLQSPSLYKRMLADIQNDLTEVVSGVLNEKIKHEINESPFISIQADETLDVNCKRQMSTIMIRYCVNYRNGEK